MENNVRDFLAFKRGEIKMPEHLAIRKEVTGPLFKSEFMERVTRTGLFPPLIMQLILASGVFWYGITQLDISITYGILYALGGFFLWSFAEYNVHRFLYHTESNSRWLFNLQHKAHSIHHQYPIDKTRLAMPPLPGLILASLFFSIFWLINSTYAFVIFPGFLIGYVTYISLHYAQHRVKSPIYGPWKALWKHHSLHHYKDPYAAYGVSTRFWDVIFGTMPEKLSK
jgi:sterol desaturase/sphingolipid hydroxylase (fatty acid hydroxylase superfamily)